MTIFEIAYLALEPLLPPLHRRVRQELQARIGCYPSPLKLLDVGGRKSHVTIGLSADVIILELPRITGVQKQLHLGLDPANIQRILARRSNVREIVLEDFTHSKIANAAFDVILSVEVLEHVEKDEQFIRQAARILKPGGLFMMTTPNGDYMPTTSNPDHRRHYKKEALERLLARNFNAFDVWYAIADTRWARRGLVSWSAKRPAATVACMVANLINNMNSDRPEIRSQAEGTNHLFAVAWAPRP